MSSETYCLKFPYFLWNINSFNLYFHHESKKFRFRGKTWVFTLRTTPGKRKPGAKIWQLHLVNVDLKEHVEANKFNYESCTEEEDVKYLSNLVNVNLEEHTEEADKFRNENCEEDQDNKRHSNVVNVNLEEHAGESGKFDNENCIENVNGKRQSNLVNVDLNGKTNKSDEFKIEILIRDKNGKLYSFGRKKVKSVNASKILLLEFIKSAFLTHDPPFISNETLGVVFKFFHDIVWIQDIANVVKCDEDFDDISLQSDPIECNLQDKWYKLQEVIPQALTQPLLWVDTFSYLVGLEKDFRSFKMDDLHLDAKLKCRDREAIPIHSQVIRDKSKVLNNMFEQNLTKGNAEVTFAVEADYPLAKKFIIYLYTGQLCELSQETAFKLYEIAAKYSIVPLKEKCFAFLGSSLNEDNVCALLAFADAHNDELLKRNAVSFMLEKEVHQKGGTWQIFCKDYPNLAIEVLSQAYQSLKSKLHLKHLTMPSNSEGFFQVPKFI